MASEIAAFGYFIPIFAFLLVFIIVYALLKKFEVLGNNNMVSFFISFILASFFVVESSLVEFVRFSSSWIAVLVVGVFFVMLIMAFMPGDKPLEFLQQGKWFSWLVIGLIFIIFIFGSSYVFQWAVGWGEVSYWIQSDWFGIILLVIIATFASWRLGKDGK